MSDSRKPRDRLASHNRTAGRKPNKKGATYLLGFGCSWALLPRVWTSRARTGLPWCRALENMQFYTYFLLLCILQQNHQTKKKGTNCPKGIHVRDTCSPSSRGVTGVAKSLSQPPSLLHGTAASLPAVSSSPHKPPSHGLVIWTVSWYIGTVSPKHSYELGKAHVTHFMSSDTAHSILPTHINSTNSAEAERQLFHQEEQELRCNNFLNLLKDQVAPSAKQTSWIAFHGYSCI